MLKRSSSFTVYSYMEYSFDEMETNERTGVRHNTRIISIGDILDGIIYHIVADQILLFLSYKFTVDSFSSKRASKT